MSQIPDPMPDHVRLRDFSDDDADMDPKVAKAIKAVGRLMDEQDLAERDRRDPFSSKKGRAAAGKTAAKFFKAMEKQEESDLDCFPSMDRDAAAKEEAKIRQEHENLVEDAEGFTIEQLTEGDEDEDEDEGEEVDDGREEVALEDEPTATPYADEVDPDRERDKLSAEMKASMARLDEIEDELDDLGADDDDL